MNLVNKLQEISTELDLIFDFGTADALNLLNRANENDTYLQLLSPIPRKKILNKYGSVEKHEWTATMFLLVQGDKTNTNSELYDNNRERTKYALEIAPLYEKSDELYQKLRGCDFAITSWKDEDTYDRLDVNLSGLVIQFTFETE